MALNLNFTGLINAFAPDGNGSITFVGTSDLFGPINITISGVQTLNTNSAYLEGTVTDGPGSGGGGIIAGLRPLVMGGFEDGEDGLPGLKGDRGLIGPSGLNALFAQDGEDGLDGLPGTIGVNGAPGAAGIAGQSALLAQDGDDGRDGLIGSQGLMGTIGATGLPGQAGLLVQDGEDGQDGLLGFGLMGLTGATGAVGSQLLFSNTTVPGGNTIANTNVETAFTSSYTIPANSLVVGDVLDIWMRGVYSTAVVPPTGRAKLKIGSTVIADTGTISALATVTNAPWWAHIQVVVQSLGATGAFECQADVEFGTTATAALTVGIPNTATFSIDTTSSEAITSTFTWGTASASNTITLREMVVYRSTITTINSAGYPSFTSNPANWPNNSPIYRSDKNLLIYFDGIRWLTVNELSFAGLPEQVVPITTSGTGSRIMWPSRSDYTVYITRLNLSTFVSGTNNGSNFWTLQLQSFGPGSSTTNLSPTVNTSADAGNSVTAHDIVINTAFSSSILAFFLNSTKTGGPAALYPWCTLYYRLIVT